MADELDDAIATCTIAVMVAVDAAIASEPDPTIRAAMAGARPKLEAMARHRCACGLREAWARHTAGGRADDDHLGRRAPARVH